MPSDLTPHRALKALKSHGAPFKTLFNHGSLEVEIYKPLGVDTQSPHPRDELYVVISGQGVFHSGDEREMPQ